MGQPSAGFTPPNTRSTETYRGTGMGKQKGPVTGWPVVTLDDDGIRPAGKPDQCFYCGSNVGQAHRRDCVTVEKRVRVRYVFEFDTTMPYGWTAENFLFHRNDGTWCADNAFDEIQSAAGNDCMCAMFTAMFTAEFVGVVDETPLVRKNTPEEVARMDATRNALLGGVQSQQ